MMWQAHSFEDGAPAQACMPFAPSAAAQALVQQSAAQLQERRRAAAAGRRRLMVRSNERRCSAAPVYGDDLLRAVHVDIPVHHVNIVRHRVSCSEERHYRLTHRALCCGMMTA